MLSEAVLMLAVLDVAIVAGLFVNTVLRRRRRPLSLEAAGGRVAPETPKVRRPLTALEVDLQESERLLRIREARFGPNHPDVASICQILGQQYLSSAEYDKAAMSLDRALMIAEQQLDGELMIASILEDLAILAERCARLDAAEEYWRRALTLRQARLIPGHPERVSATASLGRLLCRQGKYRDAETVLRPLAEAELSPSPAAVLLLSSLGVAVAEQANQVEAEELLARSRAALQAILVRGLDVQISSEFDAASTRIDMPAIETTERPAETAPSTVPLGERRARRVTLASAPIVLMWSGARGKAATIRKPILDVVRSAVSAGARAPRSSAVGEKPRTALVKPSAYSAQRRLSDAQRRVAFGLLAAIAVMGALVPFATAQFLIAAVTILYLAALGFRVHAFWRGLHAPRSIEISDEVARSVPDEDLPVYTILVPAFREPEVIGHVIASLAAIEYPTDRLDVKLLLEADDTATLEAARAANPAEHIQIVPVPVSQPRTKPKALNYGLRTARGQFITIYDAEDRPEPLQLRRAVVAFRMLRASVACLQAKLSYHNAEQNLLTRWFTAEYATWFSHLLPGLAERNMPLPLGGTSNHFRRAPLQSVGAWDPYNVTEDADLGIRLYRAGFTVEVLESTTLEEANSDFINWTKQRSRWYKGYLQTWLVHMREPMRLWRELGPAGFLAFNLFIGGTPLLTLVSPIFWALTVVWFVSHWSAIPMLFPSWLYYLGLFSLIVGNLSFLYMGVVSSRATNRPHLVPAMLIAPLYWVMMSMAAIKAVLQLIAAPSFWEKTTHGLDTVAQGKIIRALR